MLGMEIGNGLNPFAREPTPCWHCHHWGGFSPEGVHGRCVRTQQISIQARPALGCAFFEREPGADDEPDQRPPAR